MPRFAIFVENYTRMKNLCLLLLLLIAAPGCREQAPETQPAPTPLSEALMQLDWSTAWEPVGAIELDFTTFHTQGMTRVGDVFFLSAVEVKRWPRREGDKPDRVVTDEGEGFGHLFKFDSTGHLLAEIRLDEGAAYHPGGIDYDGRWIWVPVTKYYPYSYSIIYRVDPETMQAEEVLRVDDSIGAIVRDSDRNTLIGANWGAREFLRWYLDPEGNPLNAAEPVETLQTPNASFYMAAQDCQYVGGGLMFCSGLQTLYQGPASFRLGGFELIDTEDLRPVRQVPVQLFTPGGAIMTNNPCYVEVEGNELRAYFIPEDDRSTMYIYRTILPGK